MLDPCLLMRKLSHRGLPKDDGVQVVTLEPRASTSLGRLLPRPAGLLVEEHPHPWLCLFFSTSFSPGPGFVGSSFHSPCTVCASAWPQKFLEQGRGQGVMQTLVESCSAHWGDQCCASPLRFASFRGEQGVTLVFLPH